MFRSEESRQVSAAFDDGRMAHRDDGLVHGDETVLRSQQQTLENMIVGQRAMSMRFAILLACLASTTATAETLTSDKPSNVPGIHLCTFHLQEVGQGILLFNEGPCPKHISDLKQPTEERMRQVKIALPGTGVGTDPPPPKP